MPDASAPVSVKKGSVSLLTFPGPLLRLVLLGGGGLASACGRLQHRDDERPQAMWTWSEDAMAVELAVQTPTLKGGWCEDDDRCEAGGPFEHPERWLLPLAPLSPWILRLAMVAAWMMRTPRCGAAFVALGERGVNLGVVVLSLDGLPHYTMIGWWDRRTGEFWRREIIGPRLIDKRDPADLILPTLPEHLEDHPPEVALVLALYDVPEIRTRIEELFDHA